MDTEQINTLIDTIGQTVAAEPTMSEIRASMTSPRNTRLARTVDAIRLPGSTYDRINAHRVAMKLIASSPQSGAAVAARLCNYDWMVEGAIHEYAKSDRKRTMYNAIHNAYVTWLNA